MDFKLHERVTGQYLIGETIRIGDNSAACIVRCKLEECHIIIDVPRGGPAIYDSLLTNCIIETKRQIKDSQGFMHASYVRCKFKGKFLGMDFGRSPWPNKATENMTEHGELLECDFTEATLDLCRFFNADVTRQRFAPWPQFVIPIEQYRKGTALEREWPGKFSLHITGRLKENPQLDAIAGTVSDFTKRYEISSRELEESLHLIGDGMR